MPSWHTRARTSSIRSLDAQANRISVSTERSLNAPPGLPPVPGGFRTVAVRSVRLPHGLHENSLRRRLLRQTVQQHLEVRDTLAEASPRHLSGLYHGGTDNPCVHEVFPDFL
jgi:hypothetical protein